VPALGPGDLVAVGLEPSPVWRGLVEQIWGAGATLFPIDHRLPSTEAASLLALARPTWLIDLGGWKAVAGGEPVDSGVAAIVATSGTGGAPKLVELERSAVDAAVHASALALDAGPQDGWLCCLPLGHVGGLMVLLRSVLLGSQVAVHARFDPDAVGALPNVRFLSLVPTMLLRLLDARTDLRRFRAILCGGGPLPPVVRERAERSRARIVETYGLTESCGGVVYEWRPLSGVGVRIAGDGHVELGGPSLMRGYRFDAEATKGAFTDDGWLRTGDAGELRTDGTLRILGRMDGAILTGGETVWPEEIEAALREHADVADVAVAGRPDDEWGERVVAFVVPSDPLRPPTLGEIRDAAQRTVAPFKAPRELVILEDLPRTALGKLRRPDLDDTGAG
jgi:O-succinylbenzoic acid--CoA ligase